MVESRSDPARGLTEYICTGVVDRAEIMDAVSSFYADTPTPNVLWDLGDANVSALSAADVEVLAQHTVERAHSREEGKTAIVAPKDMGFGLSRMFQTFADLASHQAAVRVFRTHDEAIAWFDKE
jgi:hypothetical protein